MRGGAQGEKATPGEFITSSPSSPKSSTVGGDVPITVHPDDVLNNLLNGTNFNNVDGLVQSARESFQQMVDFYEAKSASRHPAIIAVEKEVRVVYSDYLKAIEASVKVAGHGITFAADAASLCEYLNQAPGADVRLFIDEMRKIADQVHSDAEDTYKKFSTVRGTLLLIIKEIPLQAKQIKEDQNTVLLRYRDVLFSPCNRWSGKKTHKRGKCRKIEQDAIVALELLKKAANNVGEVANCVDKVASWWSKSAITISTLWDQVVSDDGRQLSTIRISMVGKSWEVLRNDYEVYKRSINTLSDFYPVDKMRASVPRFRKIFTRKAEGR